MPGCLSPLKVPISIVLMDSVLAFGGVLGMRVGWRGFVEKGDRRRREHGKGNGHRPAVLLIGAGRAGVMAVREIQGRGETNLAVRGFVDDDPDGALAATAGNRPR